MYYVLIISLLLILLILIHNYNNNNNNIYYIQSIIYIYQLKSINQYIVIDIYIDKFIEINYYNIFIKH